MKEKVKDILKSHVHKHESPVDPAEIWASLQTEIEGDKKKDKRRFFGIFFGIAAIALVGLFGFNLFQGDSNQISDLSDKQYNKNQLKSEPIIEKNNLTEISDASKNLEPVSKTQSQKQKTNKSKSNTQSGSVQDLSNTIVKEKPSLKNTESVITKPIISQEANFSFSNSAVVNNNSSKPFLNSLGISGIAQSSSDDEEQDSEDSRDMLSNKADDSFEARPSLTTFNGLGAIGPMTISGKDRSDLITGLENFSNVDVEKFRPQRSTISVLAGAGIFTKRIVAFDESHKEYADGRESYERPLEVISAQALVTIPLVSKLNISTGIQYFQFNEELDWAGTYFVNENGEIIPAPVENLVGENYYQEINHSLTNYNQSQLFSIPILLGLSSGNKRLTYGVKAGVNVQLNTNTFGKIFNEDLIPVNALNHKFGLGLQSKFELGYFLVPGLELYSDFSVLQVNTIEELVNQRIRSYSLGLGLRKTL